MCLISKEEREYAEKIATTVKYHELAADKDFHKEYIGALYFPHKNLDKYPDTVNLLRRLGRIKWLREQNVNPLCLFTVTDFFGRSSLLKHSRKENAIAH